MKLLALLCLFCGMYSASNAITLDMLKKEHVVISSPVNITVYFTSAAEIIIGWDLRQVYIPHDVTPHNYSMLKHGDEIKVSKPHIHLVAVNSSLVNETSTPEENNKTDSGNNAIEKGEAPTVPSTEKKEGSDNGTGSQSAKEQSDDKSEDFKPGPWVCRAATYFSNYTIAIQDHPGPVDNSWSTTLLSTSSIIHMADITLKYDKRIQQRMMPFESGCVTNIRVIYRPRFGKSVAESVNVEPYHRVANISGLKEATTYNITVQAVYINDKVLSAPSHFVRTKKVEEKPQCACDWHGTVNLRNSCQIQSDGRLCQCRPEYKGQFCEECAPGYFRTAPYFPCNICPCNEYSSKKSSCRFVEGFLYCDQCEVGYTGNICHKCDKGFYRHGKFCVNCACNGNAGPKNENMCKAETGECLNCQRNTTGFLCDRCLSGYNGSAVTYRNCTLISDLNGVHGATPNSESSPPIGLIAAVVMGLLLCVALCVGFIMFKRLRARQQRRAFWTVELRRDKDSAEFSSVHNDEAHLDDMDDLEFYEHHGGTTSVNKYSRLNEQI